jgi:coenzyme F420-reducing hydrogenase delta subunit
VLVAACHEGNCRTGEGSPESLRRVGRIQSIMADVGFDPRRLERITLAPNQGSALTGRIETFAARIQDLGPVRKGDA